MPVIDTASATGRFGGEQVWRDGPQGREDADELDPQYAVPFHGVPMGERALTRRPDVIAQDLEPPELADGGVDCSANGVSVGHVDLLGPSADPAASASAACASMAATAPVDPSTASWRLIATPMPDLPPVTSDLVESSSAIWPMVVIRGFGGQGEKVLSSHRRRRAARDAGCR